MYFTSSFHIYIVLTNCMRFEEYWVREHEARPEDAYTGAAAATAATQTQTQERVY